MSPPQMILDLTDFFSFLPYGFVKNQAALLMKNSRRKGNAMTKHLILLQ